MAAGESGKTFWMAAPPGLKLSVHSGSDKFSLYPRMRAALKASDAGVHLKTAGTTWLEELIGLAGAGGEGLSIARDVYRLALDRHDEMCGPYASVISIRRERLPAPAETATSINPPKRGAPNICRSRRPATRISKRKRRTIRPSWPSWPS